MPESPPTLQAAREKTIDALCRSFAEDGLSLPELERRLARAREARTRDELRALLSDLRRSATPSVMAPAPRRSATPPAGSPGADVDRPTRSEPTGIRRGSHLAFAIMGGTRRAGRWAPPGKMLAMAILGGVELDFRDAVLTPGVTEINVFAFWGGVEITVPPGVHVDTHGLAIMGGFDQTTDQESNPPPDAPTIRVNGVAIMAGVDVNVRAPGEGKGKRTIEGSRGRSEQ